jgi:hypothetical protein
MSEVKMNVAELTTLVQAQIARIDALEAKIVELTTPKTTNSKEMTDDDARRILNGDLKGTKHKDAAEKLGLTYGQIYSCRLGFTFKAIHKELSKIDGYKNDWMK